MAIRIRKSNGHILVLCAADTKPKKGDIYLDDVVDHALRMKFLRDYKGEGLIKKPKVTEEWINEKAIELINLVGYRITGEYARHHLISAQDFIRSLVKEID